MRPKNPAAVSLGRLGGVARAGVLSDGRRKEIATVASRARKAHKGWPKGRKRGPRPPK